MSVKITPKGFERVLTRLQDMGDTSRVEKALDECALLVERDAVRHAPIDSGQTRAQTDIAKPEPLTRTVWSLGRAAFNTEYAPSLLKHGTVENPRQGPWPYDDDGKRKGTNPNATMPWLRPALYRNKRRIVERIGRSIGRSG